MLFNKRISIEEKISKLKELGLICDSDDYLKTSRYDVRGNMVTRYSIHSDKLGIVAIADTPQDAWKEAIKILGV